MTTTTKDDENVQEARWQEVLDRLEAPFPNVRWRIGSRTKDKTKGMALAYIDARDVMKRLDEVLSQEGWRDSIVVYGTVFVCHLSIWCPLYGESYDGWISKSDVAEGTDIESAKGGASDAFKRAAVKWGIGRYLYEMESPWVDLENEGKKFTGKALAQLNQMSSSAVKPAVTLVRPESLKTKSRKMTEAEILNLQRLSRRAEDSIREFGGVRTASEFVDAALGHMKVSALTDLTVDRTHEFENWLRSDWAALRDSLAVFDADKPS